jgi:gliding motility-associated protein GldM
MDRLFFYSHVTTKTSPRRKMINMMYLVLTAMLALNVSSEILKAFHKLETSIEDSGKNFDDDNAKLLTALNQGVTVQGEKAKVYRDRAYEARKITVEFNSYVDGVKKMFLEKNGGRVEDGQLKDADNMDASTDFFINKKNGNEKGKELMNKINSTREKLVALLDDKDKSNFKSDLKTEDPLPELEARKITWLEETFEKLPLAATFENLSQYQNDAKKTECTL